MGTINQERERDKAQDLELAKLGGGSVREANRAEERWRNTKRELSRAVAQDPASRACGEGVELLSANLEQSSRWSSWAWRPPHPVKIDQLFPSSTYQRAIDQQVGVLGLHHPAVVELRRAAGCLTACVRARFRGDRSVTTVARLMREPEPSEADLRDLERRAKDDYTHALEVALAAALERITQQSNPTARQQSRLGKTPESKIVRELNGQFMLPAAFRQCCAERGIEYTKKLADAHRNARSAEMRALKKLGV
jgi:hypothetical protein